MINVNQHQKNKIVSASIKEREGDWILAEIRGAYGSALAQLSDSFIIGEISECLARCDELGLFSMQDRLGFCFLDIVGFPGFRHLPNLPSIIAQCHTSTSNIENTLTELQRIAPAAFWVGLQERTLPERQRRGMPT